MTLKQLANKYLDEIGTSLTFDKAQIIGEKINSLVYKNSNRKISIVDKEIIYNYIQEGIISRKISVQMFFQDSQNSKNRSAAAYLLQIIKSENKGDNNDKV